MKCEYYINQTNEDMHYNYENNKHDERHGDLNYKKSAKLYISNRTFTDFTLLFVKYNKIKQDGTKHFIRAVSVAFCK